MEKIILNGRINLSVLQLTSFCLGNIFISQMLRFPNSLHDLEESGACLSTCGKYQECCCITQAHILSQAMGLTILNTLRRVLPGKHGADFSTELIPHGVVGEPYRTANRSLISLSEPAVAAGSSSRSLRSLSEMRPQPSDQVVAVGAGQSYSGALHGGSTELCTASGPFTARQPAHRFCHLILPFSDLAAVNIDFQISLSLVAQRLDAMNLQEPVHQSRKGGGSVEPPGVFAVRWTVGG
jgi:hypothetical protein